MFDGETAKEIVRKNKGEAAVKEVEGIDFLTFSDLEAKVKEDVEWLKGTAVEEGIRITGWVYEVLAQLLKLQRATLSNLGRDRKGQTGGLIRACCKAKECIPGDSMSTGTGACFKSRFCVEHDDCAGDLPT